MLPSIAEVVRQFKQDWTSQLEPQTIENACREAGLTWRDRLLNSVTTVQLFFLQILNGNTACTHLRHLARMAFTATAYCKARTRVKLEVFQTLLSRVAGSLGQGTLDTDLWLGHRVFLVDGSSFSMPDTPDLQQHFGQPSGQKKGNSIDVTSIQLIADAPTGTVGVHLDAKGKPTFTIHESSAWDRIAWTPALEARISGADAEFTIERDYIKFLIGGGGATYKTSARRDMGQPIGTISLTAEGGSMTVESLKVYEMTSAWKKS